MLDNRGRSIDLSRICGDVPRSGVDSKSKFQVPIERRSGGVPVVKVKFNGKQTFEMLLDTGASDVTISPAMAEALQVKQEGTVTVSTASHKQIQFPTGRVASIQVGGIVAKGMKVTISPALDVGLLGQSFFGKYDVVIKEQVIEFRPRQ